MIINEEIRDSQVRLVGIDGEQLGIISSGEALMVAQGKGLDLVKIAPKSEPPVCKIMDYGKYKFDLAKRDREAKRSQKVIAVKEIHLTPNIDDHDFNTKLEHAFKFLKSGFKVRVAVRFKGREITRPKLGETILSRFAESIGTLGAVEGAPKLEGKNMIMLIGPVKN